jgi:hypothetical protein
MTSRYKARLIMTLLLAAAAYGTYQLAGSFREAPQVPKMKLGKDKRGGSVILPKDRSLKSFSGDELQALVNEFVNEQNRHKENKLTTVREREYVVDSGSTIVTGGYESEPGVFVFTTMKFWLTDTASDPQIAFKLNREMISMNGDYKVLAATEFEIESGHGYGHDNDKYRVHLQGWILPDGRQIKVQVKESEYAHSPGVTITSGRIGDPEP